MGERKGPPPPPPPTKGSGGHFGVAGTKSGAEPGGTPGQFGSAPPGDPSQRPGEAEAQLKLHGISSQSLRELPEGQGQERFNVLSPTAQQIILGQQEGQGIKQAQRESTKNYDESFATEYEASKGLTLEGKRIEPSGTFQGTEAEYQEYLKDFEKQNKLIEAFNLGIEADVKKQVGAGFTVEQYNKWAGLYNPYVEKAYEKQIQELAGGIVKEAKEKGAAKIQIYTKEGEMLGSLGVKGAEEPLATQYRLGKEFQVGFTVPRTAEQEAELIKAKEEEKKFKAFISEYKEAGATFDIMKDGKLVGVTTREHPYYDIKKIQGKQGEVTVAPTKRLAIIQQPRQPEFETGSKEKLGLAYLTPFYNLGVFVSYAPKSMKEAFETAPKEAKSPLDYFTKGYSPKTARQMSLYELPDPSIEYLTTGKIPEGYTQREIDAYLQSNAALLFIGLGRGKAKPTQAEWVGIDFAKRAVKVPEAPTLTPKIRGTNIYRRQVPKNVFEFDTAKIPIGSAAKPMPKTVAFEELAGQKRNTILEDLSKETQAKLQKTQAGLLEPAKPFVQEPLAPSLTGIIETKGRPPIPTRPTEVFGEPKLALGASKYESRISVERVTESFISPRHEVYSAKGEFLGQFGERPPPLGALGRVEKIKVKEPDMLVQLAKGYKPRKLGKYTFAEDLADIQSRISARQGMKYKGQETIQLQTSARLQRMQSGLLRELKKGKRKERQPTAPGDVREFYSRFASTKGPKKGAKIDDALLLGPTVTQPELLAAGRPPIKTSYTKDFNEFREFQTRIEREQKQGIFTKEKGAGALGKKTLEQIVQEEKGFKQTVSAERLTSNIVGGKKIKPARRIQKVDTDAMLGLERKPSTAFIESQFRGFIEGTKRLRKEVQLEEGYQPNIKDFISRYKSKKEAGAKLEPKKIDTGKLLADLETPTIGEPKDYFGLAAKELSREQKKKLRGLQWKPRSATKPAGREMPTRGRQVLLYQTKKVEKITDAGQKAVTTLTTKKKPKTDLGVRPILVSQYQEEEQYLYKGRPRRETRQAVSIISVTQPKEKLGFKLEGLLRTRSGLKMQTAQAERQKADEGIKTMLAITPKEKQKEKQRMALVPLEVPKGVPRTKQPVPEKEKEKLKLLEVPRIPPKPPRLVIPFGLPSGKKPSLKPQKEKPGIRADFLGNVRQSDIAGIYKRSELTYGQKRINKLLRQDKPSGTKGRFVRGGEKPSRKKEYFFTQKPRKSRTTKAAKSGRWWI